MNMGRNLRSGIGRLLTVATLVLTTGVLAGCSITEGVLREEAGLAVLPSHSELVITNGNGSVSVQTHRQPGVRVSTEKKARTANAARAKELLDKTEVVLSQTAGQARVQVVVPPLQMGESVSTAMQVWVPVDFAGRLTIVTNNGEIHVNNLAGEGHFATGNGEVQVGDWEGALSVDTSNGRIAVQNTRLTGNSDFGANNGAIDLELTAINANLAATAMNGSLHVVLPPKTDGNLIAIAMNGAISLLKADGTKVETKGNLTVAGAGPKLTLQTGNGPISVEGLR